MKRMILTGLVLFSVSAHANISSKDVTGRYQVTSPYRPGVTTFIELKSGSRVVAIETTNAGKSKCVGSYSYNEADGNLHSQVKCDDGQSFTQTVFLNGVTMKSVKAGVQTKARTSAFRLMAVPIVIQKIK